MKEPCSSAAITSVSRYSFRHAGECGGHLGEVECTHTAWIAAVREFDWSPVVWLGIYGSYGWDDDIFSQFVLNVCLLVFKFSLRYPTCLCILSEFCAVSPWPPNENAGDPLWCAETELRAVMICQNIWGKVSHWLLHITIKYSSITVR